MAVVVALGKKRTIPLLCIILIVEFKSLSTHSSRINTEIESQQLLGKNIPKDLFLYTEQHSKDGGGE